MAATVDMEVFRVTFKKQKSFFCNIIAFLNV